MIFSATTVREFSSDDRTLACVFVTCDSGVAEVNDAHGHSDCSYDTGGDDEASSTEVDTTSVKQLAAVGDSTEHRLESRYTIMVFGILRRLAYSFCRVLSRNVYIMMPSY